MCGLYIILVSERFNRRPTFWISPILMVSSEGARVAAV